MQRLFPHAHKGTVIVAMLAAALVALGLYAYSQLDIEAYPNPVAPMIEVITQPSGMSAEEVERYVTIPIENGLAGMVDLQHIRSQSLFGLSDVKCYFDWTPSYVEAQQRVINRLQFISLPGGVTPQLSPWNAIGEVYRYLLRGPGYSLAELKTAQDWVLEKQFKQVPGVIDVVGFGGEIKQYHVEVDPYRLKGQNLTLSQLNAAITNGNQNVGGQRLTLGEQSYDVRALGLIHSLQDIEQIVVAAPKGAPITVHNVATVTEGAAPRLGIVGKDFDPDVVQGIVLMRYGGNALRTLKGIHERLEHVRKYHLLPPGMSIEPYYDRGHLTRLTTHTVLENLIVGMLLVSVVLWVFLGNTRAALVSAINIPLALLAAFIGMVVTATPANLISLGAVDFGIIVDSTVIVVENVFRHLGGHGTGTLAERILRAAEEIGSPMFFCTLVIVVAFVPLFTMTGVSGVIFSPLARTYAFAIGGAILLALTLTPVLASRLLRIEAAAALCAPAGLRGAQTGRLGGARAGAGRDRRGARPQPGRRVHAQARGGELLDPRHPAHVDLSRPLRPARRPHARHRARLPSGRNGELRGEEQDAPGGADGGLASRPSRRRHRSVRLLQHRAVRAPEAASGVAAWRDQGEPHRAAVARAGGGVPRGDLQLLPVHLGQRRRGDVRSEGGEHDQGRRPGPQGERGEGAPDRLRALRRARDRGPGALPFAGSAGHPHRAGSASVRPIWAQRGRRRGGRTSRGGWGGRHAGLPRGEALRSGRALGGALSEGSQDHPADPRPRAGRVADPARTACQDRHGRRRGDGVPGGHLPIRAREVLRARPRPRLDHRGGAAAHRRLGSAALRHPPGVGGRDQRAARGGGTAEVHRTHHAPAHRVPRLLLGAQLARHGSRAPGNPRGVLRGRARAAPHRYAPVDLRGHGIRLHLRRGGAGRAARRDVHAAPVARRVRARRGCTARRGTAAPAGAHDGVGRDDRPVAGGALPRPRVRDAEAVGHRRDRGRPGPGRLAAPATAGAPGPGPWWKGFHE